MRRLLSLIVFLSFFVTAFAQNEEPADSLVRLMSAQSVRMYQENGQTFRRVEGPARFLHNNTYLVCDTAIWNVDEELIDAFGNVQVIQEETVLSSEKLYYYIDEDRAEFRGGVVQLQDKDNNLLRTRRLDYNTKDSVAYFQNGASLKDKDGQIIESLEGTYDSKAKTFDFSRDVNMFTDSVFVKTESLLYDSNTQIAYFKTPLDAWRDDNMLSAQSGYYDRANEEFFFTGNVHGMGDEDKEVWADSLYVFRNTNDILLLSNAQVLDTTRKVNVLANRIYYQDSLSRITVTDKAAIIAQTEQEAQLDTMYVGADTLVYETKMMFQIDSSELNEATRRKEDIYIDPVSEYRQKALEEANKETAEQEQMNDLPAVTPSSDPNAGKQTFTRRKRESRRERRAREQAEADSLAAAIDTTALVDSIAVPIDTIALTDSIAVPIDTTALTDSIAAPIDTIALADSLAAPIDSLALADSLALLEPKDSTEIGYARIKGNVRLFRSDMQVYCDSLEYADLDSIARLYLNPIIWNEGGVHQYSADSIFLLIGENQMERASLISNAFVTIFEKDDYYDQIKSVEMMAYFDENNAVRRFDALGGSSALFYLEENEELATVNTVETKMLSATFVAGEFDRIYYFDQPNNNAYPIVQLPKEDKKMNGFRWDPELRPADPDSIVLLPVREMQMLEYAQKPKGEFVETNIYFPGYIDGIYREIEERERRELARLDSLAAARDSLQLEQEAVEPQLDTTATVQSGGEVAAADSLAAETAVADTLAAESDEVIEIEVKSPAQLARELRKAQQEARRKERLEEKEARWAELDAKDAAKLAEKEAKELERKRAKTLKKLKDAEKEAAREKKLYDRYVKRYEKRMARRIAK